MNPLIAAVVRILVSSLYKRARFQRSPFPHSSRLYLSLHFYIVLTFAVYNLGEGRAPEEKQWLQCHLTCCPVFCSFFEARMTLP